MQVLKFGGTSVANAENINKVISIAQKASESDKTIVVVSALGGITDMLLKTATLASVGDESFKESLQEIEQRHLQLVKQLIPVATQSQWLSLVKTCSNEIEDICNGIFYLRELTPRTKDRVSSYGEWLSSKIIAAACSHAGTEAVWKDAKELILTNSNYTNAEPDFETTNKNCTDYFTTHQAQVFIIPGFIAANSEGITTTLGRGGSDYTASILASAVDASHLEIWTDVSGLMTADPRLTSNARIIPTISYQEAMELSHFGAKVIYPPTIQPVLIKNIPIWIKNTFSPDDSGTLISNQTGIIEQPNTGSSIVKGITSIGNISLLTLEGSGMIGIPGFSKRLFAALSVQKINVILITQSSSEHSICVAVESGLAEGAKMAVDAEFSQEVAMGKVDALAVENNLSVIALVGESMKNHPGISGRMFSAMGRNGINIRAIAQGSSEKNISAVVSNVDVKKAINVLHEEFFETTYKQLNLFIAGTGNVGAKLISQLLGQRDFLQKQYRLQIKVAGLSNSKKMLIDANGIDLEKWRESLQQGASADLNGFVQQIIGANLQNSIFVDVTANADVAGVYQDLLLKSISVVACNKIAASSPYQVYKNLKDTAAEYNCKFLFETNVGAALPIIGTLSDLIHSGDKILRIEAVLSGTLNFVFNNYDGNKKFGDVVKQAQDEGYTEPDPRLDLSGVDVMRKIMILARESGVALEMDSIVNNSFMPEKCMQGSVDDFYQSMLQEEAHFKQLLDAATDAGCKLKFVAGFSNPNEGSPSASVGLQQIGPSHNLYHIYGKDNIVLFYTERYPENPLVVKGAGAGAEVTASGVFADIIRAGKV